MPTQYNPCWPFPQYDADGRQLLPPGWSKTPSRSEELTQLADQLGEALL